MFSRRSTFCVAVSDARGFLVGSVVGFLVLVVDGDMTALYSVGVERGSAEAYVDGPVSVRLSMR